MILPGKDPAPVGRTAKNRGPTERIRPYELNLWVDAHAERARRKEGELDHWLAMQSNPRPLAYQLQARKGLASEAQACHETSRAVQLLGSIHRSGLSIRESSPTGASRS